MPEPSVEMRAIIALMRYAFPNNQIRFVHERATDIAKGDAEVEQLLGDVGSLVAAISGK